MAYLKGVTEESLKKRTFAKTQAGKVKHLWLGITTTHLDLREQRGPEGENCILDLARVAVQGGNSEICYSLLCPFRISTHSYR